MRPALGSDIAVPVKRIVEVLVLVLMGNDTVFYK